MGPFNAIGDSNDDDSICSGISIVSAKSEIFRTMAELEFKRENNYLAQHFICQALLQLQSVDDRDDDEYDDIYPTVKKTSIKVWKLWSNIANRMDNEELEKQCLDQVCLIEGKNKVNSNEKSIHKAIENKKVVARQMKKMLGKAPWYRKLFL